MNKKILMVLALLFFLVLTSCSDAQAEGLSQLENIEKVEIEYDLYEVKRTSVSEMLEMTNLIHVTASNYEYRLPFETTVKEVFYKLGDYVPVGAVIATFDTSEIEKEMHFLGYEIEKEEILYDRLISQGASSEEIRIKVLELEILAKEMEALERRKRSCTIKANKSCYLTRMSLSPGKYCHANMSLIVAREKGDNGMANATEVDLRKYRNIQVGDRADLVLLGFEAEGIVTFIYETGGDYGKVFIKLAEPNYELSQLEGPFKFKFNDIDIDDAIVVPYRAVKNNKKDYVEVYKDGIKRVRYVTTGIKGLDEEGQLVIEILSGLQEGDQVIVGELK